MRDLTQRDWGFLIAIVLLLVFAVGSQSLYISPGEKSVGDSISLKQELSGRVTIPPEFGDCDDENYEGICWRFDPDSLLEADIVVDVVGIGQSHPDRLVYTIRCGNSPKDITKGYWHGCYRIIDAEGKPQTPLYCPDHPTIAGDCVILRGSKSWNLANGSPTTDEFVITNKMWYTGAGRDGVRIAVSSPAFTEDTVDVAISMQLIAFGGEPDTQQGWIVDACVASPGLTCESEIIDDPDEAEEKIEDIIEDIERDLEEDAEFQSTGTALREPGAPSQPSISSPEQRSALGVLLGLGALCLGGWWWFSRKG